MQSTVDEIGIESVDTTPKTETYEDLIDVDALIAECSGYFWEGLRPPPDFTIDEWADLNRVLPKESSGESGLWRTSRTPYLREIMQELSPKSHAEKIVFMKGSQVGATEAMLNTALYYIAHAPCPMLLVEPTIDTIKKVSKQRLQPSINNCEQAKVKISSGSKKDGNTLFQKDYPGGTLILASANSASALRSMPIMIGLLDEIDGYPEDVDGEGDPVELAVRRTTNFSRRKIFYVSTPAIAETSKIEKLFNESDQRYYFVPCPFCGHMQIIKWDNIKFENRDPKTVRLVCENSECKKDIHEHHKTRMLERGEWRAQNPASEIPGFHLSALYSPLGWYSWKEAVYDHIKAIGDRSKRVSFVNTVLGEVFDENSSTIDFHYLKKRRELYVSEIPEPVLCLVAGVDHQDDRLECSIVGVGWSDNPEYWLIDHSVFMGDPKQPHVWGLLDMHLQKQWQHPSGCLMQIASTCIDAMGHCTDDVYKFCRPREFRRIFPSKGLPGAGRSLISRMKRQERGNVMLVQIGVDQAKAGLYSNLLLPDPGAGYIHFPIYLPGHRKEAPRELGEDYFKQLTAEKKMLRHGAGSPKYQWVCPAGKRNEALDCWVYAMAALAVSNIKLEMLAREKIVYRAMYSNKKQPPRRRLLSAGVKP
jgi:phage terminase large subunit GpA-like protein